MKNEKQYLLNELRGQMDQSNAFIIAGYKSLTANKANDFRAHLRKSGGSFEVVKKRVFIKALEAAGISYDVDQLPGHIGIIFAAQDPIEITKTVLKFSKENDDAFALIGGRLDGVMIGAKDMERVAKLPSKDEMRAQFLGLLEAPMAQTLSVVEAILSSVVCCIDNKAKQG